ncbi:hypothetical protein WN48_07464 [Eufriesea mexicana]|uniref:Uncharacterized protein n=1 Tax=Eufriesea mexicana TaxID=516756 RepID=A0A310SSL1_9HYME|nr:hypothetical protein WN48_07464 [Eufriesea mexicana]
MFAKRQDVQQASNKAWKNKNKKVDSGPKATIRVVNGKQVAVLGIGYEYLTGLYRFIVAFLISSILI